jgi:HAD superfamily hydrolase (TIGR01509 family)
MQAVKLRKQERGLGRRPLRAALPLPAVAPREAPSVDDLAGQWWAALEVGRSALHAAALYLPAAELAERSARLREERAESTGLLADLARARGTESRLLRLLAAPALRRPMLGLPERVSACIFELDGALTTSAAAHAAAWAETFDSFLLERADRSGRPFAPFRGRDYPEHLAGTPRLDGVRAFLASRGISLPEGSRDDPPGAATVHGLANRKNRALQRRLDRQGVDAFAGVRCYLEAARMLGLRRAVVSASSNTVLMLERAGLADLVEECIDGRAIETERLRAKPAPDTLLAACRRLGVDPEHAAAFETTPAGIAAARAAGVALAVAVNAEASWASEADLVVDDLADLLDRSFR